MGWSSAAMRGRPLADLDRHDALPPRRQRRPKRECYRIRAACQGAAGLRRKEIASWSPLSSFRSRVSMFAANRSEAFLGTAKILRDTSDFPVPNDGDGPSCVTILTKELVRIPVWPLLMTAVGRPCRRTNPSRSGLRGNLAAPIAVFAEHSRGMSLLLCTAQFRVVSSRRSCVFDFLDKQTLPPDFPRAARPHRSPES